MGGKTWRNDITANTLGPFLLGPNDTPENGIYTGDARELAKAIPDESVDLIFTDPVYQNIDDYRWLAKTAARVLRADRACLCFCGIGYLPEAMNALKAGGLSYRWQLILYYSNRVNRLHVDAGYSGYTTCLWFQKGEMKRRKGRDLLPCAVFQNLTSTNGRSNHIWGKPQSFYEFWLPLFPNTIVLDPFTGGGTVPAVCKMLGRRYLAFEIDPDVAETARQRVRQTQPPLFTLQPEQAELAL